LLLDLPPGQQLRGAVVGLAGGVTPRQWDHFWGRTYDLLIDGAELDPDVVALGRRHFHLPPEGTDWLRVRIMDGRQMLATLPADVSYHMLVVDAFSQEYYIPFHLATREFFELAKSRLADGGVFAMNVYAYSADAEILTAIENTLATVFGRCQRVKQKWGGNFLLLAKKGGEPADVTRLLESRARTRFGSRADVAEWDTLMGQASWIPEHTTLVSPVDARPVLTDDLCPLELMADRSFREIESEILGD
jgi:hypothetical protein